MQIQGFLIMLFIYLITFDLNAQKVEFSLEDLEIVVQSSTHTIYLGEKYIAEISFNQKIPETYKIQVSVGGSSLRVENQKANYTATGSRVGERRVMFKVVLRDAKEGLIRSLEKEISYNIRVTRVNIFADKMNVFYVGVNNPITLMAADISASALKVEISGDGARLRKIGRTSYIVTCEKQGSITLTLENKETGKRYYFKYRAKKIPEPSIRLGKLADGDITVATFVQQPGLATWLYGFDFDARCTVKQYKVLHYNKKNKMVEMLNTGGRFEEATLAEIKKAKPGDVYIFTEVEGDCPKDTASRHFNSLVFKIK
jgi:hypothetical protein